MSPVVRVARVEGLTIDGPSPCVQNGLCNLCGQRSALTRGGRIKDSAKAWTLAFDWVRIRVCRECMVIMGNSLHDAILTADSGG